MQGGGLRKRGYAVAIDRSHKERGLIYFINSDPTAAVKGSDRLGQGNRLGECRKWAESERWSNGGNGSYGGRSNPSL